MRRAHARGRTRGGFRSGNAEPDTKRVLHGWDTAERKWVDQFLGTGGATGRAIARCDQRRQQQGKIRVRVKPF